MRARPGDSSWPLVVFTVLVQASAGVAVVTAILPCREQTLSALLLLVLGGTAAAFHLGRVTRGRFALSNLSSSWLSREILFAAAYGALLLATIAIPDTSALRYAAAAAGLVLVGVISQVYRIRTVPTWDSWMTPASFILTAVVLGTALASRSLDGRWQGIGLIHVAAAASLPQAVLILRRDRGAGSRLGGLYPIIVAIAWLVVALAPAYDYGATYLFFGAELAGRYAFYASHRRVGL